MITKPIRLSLLVGSEDYWLLHDPMQDLYQIGGGLPLSIDCWNRTKRIVTYQHIVTHILHYHS